MVRLTRPTLRCLQEDIDLPLPTLDESLDEIDHAILKKSVQQFKDHDGQRERIRSIDDQVLFKVKAGRWRGAVWIDKETRQPWLVAAGLREDGSPDDFYEALTTRVRADRNRYNERNAPALTTEAHSAGILPNKDDGDRYAAESAIRFLQHIKSTLDSLVRSSLLDGEEHVARLSGADARIGILVRADDGHETYVAVHIIGSVPHNLLTVLLARVPGCDRDGWYPEIAMPTRPPHAGEQIWSNLMDPAIAAKLLEE